MRSLVLLGFVVSSLVVLACGDELTQELQVPESCDCIDLAATYEETSQREFCDCPEFRYGCVDDPQTFTRACDVAKGCWVSVTDPETGCPMPAFRGGGGECTC